MCSTFEQDSALLHLAESHRCAVSFFTQTPLQRRLCPIRVTDGQFRRLSGMNTPATAGLVRSKTISLSAPLPGRESLETPGDTRRRHETRNNHLRHWCHPLQKTEGRAARDLARGEFLRLPGASKARLRCDRGTAWNGRGRIEARSSRVERMTPLATIRLIACDRP